MIKDFYNIYVCIVKNVEIVVLKLSVKNIGCTLDRILYWMNFDYSLSKRNGYNSRCNFGLF